MELFDEESRIPRNLHCGHSFCQVCLSSLASRRDYIECPQCKAEMSAFNFNPSSLPINYIILEVIREKAKPVDSLCEIHSTQQLILFCTTCQSYICAECTVDHSGHNFVSKDSSTAQLGEAISDTEERIQALQTRMQTIKRRVSSLEEDLNGRIETDEELLKTSFKAFESALSTRHEELLTTLEPMYSKHKTNIQMAIDQFSTGDIHKAEITGQLGKIEEEISDLEALSSEETKKYLDRLDSLTELVLENKSSRGRDQVMHFPEVVLNKKKVSTYLSRIGVLASFSQAYGPKNPKIGFFGERKRILHYDITTNQWESSVLHPQSPEFPYYSAAVTLPNGLAFITGGGCSSACYILKDNILIPRAPMLYRRKEHAAVLLNGYVYTFGGYDGSAKEFLTQCEKFDIAKNAWITCSPMNVPRCAAGACTVGNKNIYVFGGYDGNERVGSIERYDPRSDHWELIDVELLAPMSNCACFSPARNKIVILGGGFSSGFSLRVQMLDVETEQWIALPKMTDGRDLRNKITFFEGNAFAIGGTENRAEKYSFLHQEWTPVPKYPIDDNLDSWSSALVYTLDNGRE